MFIFWCDFPSRILGTVESQAVSDPTKMVWCRWKAGVREQLKMGTGFLSALTESNN